jgi:hypothetical protein
MEAIIRTKKHYWHFKGWRLFRKVTTWDWDKVLEGVDALYAVQAEELELELEERRPWREAFDRAVETSSKQASGWRRMEDMTMPTAEELPPKGK